VRATKAPDLEPENLNQDSSSVIFDVKVRAIRTCVTLSEKDY
jgi:hypothetical protein